MAAVATVDQLYSQNDTTQSTQRVRGTIVLSNNYVAHGDTLALNLYGIQAHGVPRSVWIFEYPAIGSSPSGYLLSYGPGTNNVLGDPSTTPPTTPANMPIQIMRSESAMANYIAAECAAGRDDVDAPTFLAAAEKDAKLLMNNSDVKLKQRRPLQRRAYAGHRRGFYGTNQGY